MPILMLNFGVSNKKRFMIKKLTNNRFCCWNYSKHCYTKPEVGLRLIVQARDDLTLFCDIYNVFMMFRIDFFVLNLNPMNASLKNLSIFVDSSSKVNLKVKYDFSRNKARNKCNTSFLCDFDWAIHF